MKIDKHMTEYPRIDHSLMYIQTSPKHFIVKQTKTGRYFRLSSETVRVMQCLDGTKTLAMVSDELELDVTLIHYVVDQLDWLRLLELSTLASEYQPGKRKHTITISNIIFIRRAIISDDTWMENVSRVLRLRYIFRPWFGIVLLMLYAVGAMIYIRYRDVLGLAVGSILMLQQNLPVYLALFLPVVFICTTLHEFAHGFACKHFGGKIRSIGIGLYLLMPATYSDVTDAWMFTKRYQRIITHAAGLIMNFFITALALFFVPLGLHHRWLIEIIAMIFLVSFLHTLVNFNPLIKLDGYYILADALGIDNLKEKAFFVLFSSIHLVLHRTKLMHTSPLRQASSSSHPRLEKCFLFVYGLLSLAYMFFLLPYLITRYTGFLPSYLGNWTWFISGSAILLLVIVPFWRNWEKYNLRFRLRMRYIA